MTVNLLFPKMLNIRLSTKKGFNFILISYFCIVQFPDTNTKKIKNYEIRCLVFEKNYTFLWFQIRLYGMEKKIRVFYFWTIRANNVWHWTLNEKWVEFLIIDLCCGSFLFELNKIEADKTAYNKRHVSNKIAIL